MTAWLSLLGGRRPARLLAVSCGVGSRTSSSSVIPRVAPRRCMRCCGATRRSTCPSSRSRSSSRASCPAGRTAIGRPRRLEEYLALFAAARPEQRIGEASAVLPVVANRRREDRRSGARARASIAILREPASFLRSLHLQCLQIALRDRERPAHGAVAGGGQASRAQASARARAGRRCCSTPSTCAMSSSCAAIARSFPTSAVLVLIYEDFRSDNETTVRQVLRFLEVDDTAAIDATGGQPDRSVCARRDSTISSMRCSIGQGPIAGAAKASVKTLTPQALRHGALRAVSATSGLQRAAAARGAADARAACAASSPRSRR